MISRFGPRAIASRGDLAATVRSDEELTVTAIEARKMLKVPRSSRSGLTEPNTVGRGLAPSPGKRNPELRGE